MYRLNFACCATNHSEESANSPHFLFIRGEYTAIMGRSSCPCQFVADKRRPVLKHGPRSLTCVCLCAEQAPWQDECLDMCTCNRQRFRFFFFLRRSFSIRYFLPLPVLFLGVPFFFPEYVLNYRLPVLFLRFEKGNHLARGVPGIPQTYSPTTGHESQRNGQKVDSVVRESPEQGVFPAGLW